jgi:hypothetical protein
MCGQSENVMQATARGRKKETRQQLDLFSVIKGQATPEIALRRPRRKIATGRLSAMLSL